MHNHIIVAAIGGLFFAACASSNATTDQTATAQDKPHKVHKSSHNGHDGGGMKHGFSDADKWSKVFDDPKRTVWQKPAEVVALLAITPGSTVADIGAGTGYFVSHLTKAVGAGGRVLALDVEPNLIAHMKKRAAAQGWANVEVKKVAYDDPMLPAGGVERVLIVNTWHHISHRPMYAKKILAGLRPGGTLTVVDFTNESPIGPPAKHRLLPQTVIDELKAAGFAAKVVAETLPHQYVVVGTKPE